MLMFSRFFAFLHSIFWKIASYKETRHIWATEEDESGINETGQVDGLYDSFVKEQEKISVLKSTT